MSTWAPRPVDCPACGESYEVPLLKGMHITRLPEVRQAIVDGTFQVFSCPACDHPVGLERPTVYTDFRAKQYIAMELGGTDDLGACQALHQKVFDECFLFGPDIAADLAQGMTCRLVFGIRALREKVLAWDAGLDDRAVEGVKLAVFGERDWDPAAVQLRLLAVHQGGHLLFGAYPIHRRPAHPGPAVVPNDPALDHVTLRAATYEAVLADLPRLRGEAPWIFDPWLVDASLGALARA